MRVFRGQHREHDRSAGSSPPGDGRTRAPAPRRLRRIIVLLVGAAACGAVVYGLAGSHASDPVLSETQWNRVLRQFARAAPGAEGPAPGAPSSEAPGADAAKAGAGPEPAEAFPSPRARLPLPELEPEVLRARGAEYDARRPKTIVELQQFRHTTETDIAGAGGRRGRATLINLNPAINAWYLLRLRWDGEDAAATHHLANAEPDRQTLVLDPDFPHGLSISDMRGSRRCDLWSGDTPRGLSEAAAERTPYAMLCDESLVLRLRTAGRKTAMERTTDFLRDRIWGGEDLTVLVRETFFQDAYLSAAALTEGGEPAPARPGAPLAADVDAAHGDRMLERRDLGLELGGTGGSRLAVGRWYPVFGDPGIFASAIQPGLVASEILRSHTDVVARLDEVEGAAAAYLVAFDLERFDVGFALGTDHPRLGWSDRVPGERREASLPGPDGIDRPDPLVRTGIVSGALAPRAVATFTGGFKRTHGGFRYGDLAFANHGSHYGFIEEGVVFSKLQPGLSTIYVLDEGSFEMKTWTREDDELLERIRFARQNGVPIIERADGGTGGVPGSLVSRFGAGNWSGSQDGRYRTLRAGACLQESDGGRFLIYGYFSSATPSAMARVFQAYRCRYAMLLDMNALEHTYLAVYGLRGSELAVQHLVRGMEVLDKTEHGLLLPRFLGFADNRDFFYLLRRPTASREVLGS